MMSTGTILQPCFEAQFIETATIKLKFAPQEPVELSRNPADAMAMHVGGNAAAKADHGELSFQQILANICSNPKETTEKETVYVHPLSRRSSSSSSRLSEKSFQMCTENLGSETGTDIITDSSILSLSQCFNNSPREKSSSPKEYSSKNKVNSRNFPPPLTTISGGNSIHVRPHREGGRLVIRAIEAPVKHAVLRAERSNGRLRMSLLKDQYASEFDWQEKYEVDSGSSVDDDEDEIDVAEENESYINDEDLAENQEFDKDHENEDDDESDAAQLMTCSCSNNKDIDANNFDIEVEMGMEKFQRLSRCNEGGHSNKGLYNWEPLWVATS